MQDDGRGHWDSAHGSAVSPLELRGMVQQTNTYVMSRVYLLCGGGKAIKITFKVKE